MTSSFDVAGIGALIRRRGLPERPVAQRQVSEIRSDQFLDPLKTLEAKFQPVALAPLVIEWSFSVPYDKMTEFQQFLYNNESFIASGCAAAMSGVAYHGTYIGATGQRNMYRTLWGYESWDALQEWSKVAEGSQLFEAVRILRSYWTADPAATQEHLAFAAQVVPSDYPFLNLTIKSA